MRRLLSTSARAQLGQLTHGCQHRMSTLHKIVAKQQLEHSKEHANRLQEFETFMLRVYLHDQLTAKFNRQTARKLASLGLNHPKPISGILQFFETKCRKGFNDTLLATLVQRLGHIMKSLRQDKQLSNGGEKEVPPTITQLKELYSHRLFDEVLNEIRYGLNKGVYMSYRNIATVLQGLTDMDYIDSELMELAINKIERMLLKQDDTLEITKGYGKNPQIERKYYYFGGDLFDRTELLKNPLFNNVVEIILKKSAKEEKEKAIEQDLNREIKEIFGEDSASIAEELVELTHEVGRTRQNLESYSAAVLAVRNRYYLMCKSQREIATALADPNLNLELLELEERLLQLKLISIEEVKNPELLNDPERNISETTKIIQNNLSDGLAGNISFVDALVKHTNMPTPAVERASEEQVLVDMLCCIDKLVNYATVSSREVYSHGLSENKWTKQILANSEGSTVLNADRIFRKRYAVLLQRFSSFAPIISQLVAEQSPRLTVFWSHTLIKLGHHKEALKALPRLTEEMLPTSPRHLFILVETINNLVNRVDISQSLEGLLSRLTKLAESRQLYREKTKRQNLYEEPLGLFELSTIANWLSNNGLEKHPLYVNIAEQLKHRIQHLRIPQFAAGYGYAAEIVKSYDPTVELPAMDPAYDPYNFRIAHFNPILETICKAFTKYLDVPSALQVSPYLLLGFSHISQAKITGLYILPQAVTCLEGKFIDGNVTAHLNRIKNADNVELETLPLMSFLDYNTSSFDVSLKSKDTLEPFFKSVLKIEDGELFAMVSTLSQALAELSATKLSWRNQQAIRKVSRTLQALLKFNKIEKTTNHHELARINRANVLEGLNLLQKELFLLDKATFKSLQQMIKQPISRLIKSIHSILSKELHSVLKGQGIPGPALDFQGKRQSIDKVDPPTPEQVEAAKHLRNLELLDFEFYEDSHYHQYGDWKQKIGEAYGEINCADIAVEKCSSLTRLALGSNAPRTLSLTPGRQPRRLLTTGYPLSWESIYMVDDSHSESELNVERIAKQQLLATPEAEKMVELQNFKQEVKVGGSQAIFGLLNSLDFIDELISRSLSKPNPKGDSVQPLPRAPEEYFNYLQRKSLNLVEKSPYLSYIFSKMQRHERLRELFQLLDQNNRDDQVLIHHNKLTYQQHTQKRKKIEAAILTELNNFQEELVEDKVLVAAAPSRRVYKADIDKEDLQRFFSCTTTYNLEEDDDVILNNGDLSKALALKRERSEHKLIRSRILYRVNQGQALTPLEKEYAAKWAKGEFVPAGSSISASLDTVSEKDKSLIGSYCKVVPTTAISDLILEFALFFDDATLAVISNSLQNNFTVSLENTITKAFDEIGVRKANQQFFKQLEQMKFDKESKLTENDIESVLAVSKMLKSESPALRRVYDRVYQNSRSQLAALNESPSRTAFITEWYRAKENEYDNEYTPAEFAKNKESDAAVVWKTLTDIPYAKITAAELTTAVNQLCERMYLLRKYQPPFFKLLILKLLSHPRLRISDRNNLLGTIELMKVQIDLDSEDISALASADTPQRLQAEAPLAKWITRQVQSLPV